MREVGVFEAKNRLTVLLSEVENGGEVIITRRGRPIARLGPVEARRDSGKAARAAAGLRALSKGHRLGGLTLKELVSDGRR